MHFINALRAPTHCLTITATHINLTLLTCRMGVISATKRISTHSSLPLLNALSLLQPARIRHFLDMSIPVKQRRHQSIIICIENEGPGSGLLIQLVALLQPLGLSPFLITSTPLFVDNKYSFYNDILALPNFLAPNGPTPVYRALEPFKRMSIGMLGSVAIMYSCLTSYTLYAYHPYQEQAEQTVTKSPDTSTAQLLSMLAVSCPPNVSIYSLNNSPMRLIIQSRQVASLSAACRRIQSFFSYLQIRCTAPTFHYGLPPFYRCTITAPSCFNIKTIYHGTPAHEKISAHL